MNGRLTLRGRWSRVMVSTILATGALVGMSGTAEAPAGAIGTLHKFPLAVKSTGPAMEKAARLQMVCNDATGDIKITLTNVQVIQANAIEAWDQTTPGTGWEIVFPVPASGAYFLTLSQNTTNGLFQYKGTINPHVDFGTGPTEYCYTGSVFTVLDSGAEGAQGDNLAMVGTLG